MSDPRQSKLETDVLARLKEEIRGFIRENFLFENGGGGSLGDADSLLEKGIIDSTGILELVTFVEETYGIQVEDDELIPENLDSIENLAAFIRRKREP